MEARGYFSLSELILWPRPCFWQYSATQILRPCINPGRKDPVLLPFPEPPPPPAPQLAPAARRQHGGWRGQASHTGPATCVYGRFGNRSLYIWEGLDYFQKRKKQKGLVGRGIDLVSKETPFYKIVSLLLDSYQRNVQLIKRPEHH